MPPWVAREQKTNPLAPRVTPPMSMRENENTRERENTTPQTSFRAPFTKPFAPLMRETIVPSIAREDAPNPAEKNDSSRHSFQSGEVTLDDSISSEAKRKPIGEPFATPPPSAHPSHAAHSSEMDREMTEEEALQKLPFEDVEGLSADDLAYLERKEKEHRAAQEKEESDHVSPEALRAQLDRQSHPSAATGGSAPQNAQDSGNDEKKKILERLRHMMAAENTPNADN